MSRDYVRALSQKTGISEKEIEEKILYAKPKIKEILDEAVSLNSKGVLTSNNLAKIFRKKSLRFV